MLRFLKALLRPHLFLGSGKATRYHESWFYHQQSMQSPVMGRRPFSFSVEVGYTIDQLERYSYVQFVDGHTNSSRRFLYPLAALKHRDKPFTLWVGSNRFSLDSIVLRLADEQGRIDADLSLGPMIKPRRNLLQPSSMAPLFVLPLLIARHEIISLYHECKGLLTISPASDKLPPMEYLGESGYGVMEKNWGRIVQRGWIRIQATIFDGIPPPSAFNLALARLEGNPFRKVVFCLIIMLGTRQLRFAPFTGAKIDLLEERDDGLRILISDAIYKIEINARRSPTSSELSSTKPRLNDSSLRVLIKRRHGPTEDIIFDAASDSASVELYREDGVTHLVDDAATS